MRGRVAFLIATTACTLSACSLIAGPILDKAESGDASTDGTVGDAQPDVVDAQPTAQCSPFDCKNPACLDAGYACVPIPPGFDYLVPGSTCADGSVLETYYLDASGAPANCSCGCTAPGCMSGSWTASSAATCLPDGSVTTHTAGDGGCVDASLQDPPGSTLYRPVPPSGGSCATTPTKTVPNATTDSWNACLSATTSTGCDPGSMCVLAKQSACIVGAGACPSQFPNATSVGAVSDTRDCSTCSNCSLGCSATLTIYGDNACGAAPTNAPLDGSCLDNKSCQTTCMFYDYGSYRYSATGTCSATSSPTGGVTLSNVVTRCCP
jgi:hypothetical protein